MGLVRCIAARLRLFHRWNCPCLNREVRSTDWLGAYGELAAASFLRAAGCSVLRRNWRPVRGGVLVEVKTRTHGGYGGARRAVNARKRALIRQGAAEWLRQLPDTVPFRYDIVEVMYREGEVPEITRLCGAFGERDLAAS